MRFQHRETRYERNMFSQAPARCHCHSSLEYTCVFSTYLYIRLIKAAIGTTAGARRRGAKADQYRVGHRPMPLGAYRPRIVVLCFLIVLMDGFDRQAIGFVATDVASSLDIPIQSFGPVFSAGLLGAMPGAFVLGPLGDHFGRRWMLTGSAITFATFSLLTPHASNFASFLQVRLLAGFGLGGAIPNLLALSSEYAPRHIRGLLIGLLWAGFPLGGAIAAVTGAHLVPRLGWPALSYVGGLIPVLLAVLVASAVPHGSLLHRRGTMRPKRREASGVGSIPGAVRPDHQSEARAGPACRQD